MKKKIFVSHKDKKDWISFTKNTKEVFDKDRELFNEHVKIKKIPRLDLHGYILDAANKKVKEFILESMQNGYKKLLIITGKGLRSKVIDDPYKSANMNTLKHSVPEFIKNDLDLSNLVVKITSAPSNEGGEGAFHIYLKEKKTL